VTTFALVHGAWHGGWAFDPVVEHLTAAGHRAVAPDLPCEDPEAGAERYADVVEQAIGPPDGDLVVVGHSLGGLTAPLVARRRPVRRLVFVCGLLPEPGRPLSDRFSDPDIFVPGPGERTARGEDGLSRWLSEDDAIAAMYADCKPEVARGAAARLRGQAPLPSREASPLDRWPDVPSSYLLCTEDLMVGPAWSRRVAREQLGVEPIEWPGSHSPMLARPRELAGLLVELAQA
jgi:pimeloyl-ACP methyl ester carboxylesterase